MQKRKLSGQGLEVSALGLGCMGMSWAYGGADEAQVIGVLHRSLDLGINFWDTARLYGPFRYLEENARAAELSLPETAWSALDDAVASFEISGLRYPEAAMRTIDIPE